MVSADGPVGLLAAAPSAVAGAATAPTVAAGAARVVAAGAAVLSLSGVRAVALWDLVLLCELELRVTGYFFTTVVFAADGFLVDFVWRIGSVRMNPPMPGPMPMRMPDSAEAASGAAANRARQRMDGTAKRRAKPARQGRLSLHRRAADIFLSPLRYLGPPQFGGHFGDGLELP